ncbi:hypothetical protein [Micromonospora sp. WMMD710]|uniref:hypothetical protein n=1 Tax=Micromonospora sp. WMMD710 TaxID=3016085 RepID=UPI002416E9FC|nr:hypothetical protein [Micromonospora sp. WMMD710]MDG4759288.1 hypothetical protein [Micromonospora sp. WMMD710]
MLATLTLPEKERQAHAFAAAVALRMAHAGEDEATARTSVTEIREIADGYGYTFAEAQAGYDDPRNKVMCTTCGWTNGMVCPECPGCGCYNGQCSGLAAQRVHGRRRTPRPQRVPRLRRRHAEPLRLPLPR